LFESTILLVNAAMQLMLPISTVYCIIKGKEAAREYFNVKKYRLNRQGLWEDRSVTMKKIVRAIPIPPSPHPRRKIEDFEKNQHADSANASLFFEEKERCRTKTEGDVASMIFLSCPDWMRQKFREYIHS
jgi:hypothetical protein